MTRMVRLHAVHHFKGGALEQMFVGADNADDGRRLTSTQVDLVAKIFHTIDNGSLHLGALRPAS